MDIREDRVVANEAHQESATVLRSFDYRFPRRKFLPPQLPRTYVPEENLLPLVFDLDAWRVCLISVSAGYGKTSLMRQWYDAFDSTESCQPLWMELDTQDCDPYRFACALCHLFDTFDEDFFALREAGSGTDTVEDILVDVINLADRRLDENKNYILFFDDYDPASSNALDQVFLFLNKYAADNIHLVIAGNRLSSAIEDMLLDSSALVFRNKDICFTRERARAFANEAFPDIGDEEFVSLDELIGAWPAGWVFYRLALQRAERGDWKSCLKSYCGRLFDKEVMDIVEPKVYEFLVETSFLEELYPELCDAVTGYGQARGVLDELVSKNLFIRYDPERDAYLHQPMFRQFLVEKFLAFPSSYISQLSSRASEWYAQHEMSAARAKTLALATDGIYIQSTIYDSTGMKWSGEYNSFTEYLVAKPSVAFMTEPFLVWVSLWSFIASGLVEDARRQLDLARSVSDTSANENAFDYADAICTALEGDSAGSLKIIKRVLGSSDELPHGFQCLLIHMEGEDEERLGNVQAGRDLYLKAVSLAERESGVFYKLFDYYLLAHHHLCIGNYAEALAYAARGRIECESNTTLRNEFATIEACVYMEQGDLSRAAEMLAEAFSGLSSNMNADVYVHAVVTLARLNMLRNNSIEALEILNVAAGVIKGKHVPRNLDMELHAYRAIYALETGDTAVASIAESAIDGFLDSDDVLRVIPCMLAKSCLLWSRGEDTAALAELARCREAIQRCESNYYLAFSYVIEARFVCESGSATKATACINRAIELSMREEYRSIFVSGGPQVREILFKIVTSRKTSSAIRAYTKSILLSFGTEPEVENDISLREGDITGIYSLTSREREILNMLNNGMSRAEISEMLSLSQNTVKSHLKNIYAKLGVHTRSEAYKASQVVETAGALEGE